jgi:hypothetical protein
MHDFRDEVPGYLDNRAICKALEELDLRAGIEPLGGNMRLAYRVLVERGWLDERELELLDAWLADLAQIRAPAPARTASPSQSRV